MKPVQITGAGRPGRGPDCVAFFVEERTSRSVY